MMVEQIHPMSYLRKWIRAREAAAFHKAHPPVGETRERPRTMADRLRVARGVSSYLRSRK